MTAVSALFFCLAESDARKVEAWCSERDTAEVKASGGVELVPTRAWPALETPTRDPRHATRKVGVHPHWPSSVNPGCLLVMACSWVGVHVNATEPCMGVPMACAVNDDERRD